MGNIVIITIGSCCNHFQSIYASLESFKEGLEHDDCDRAFMFEVFDGELSMVKEFCESEIKSLRSELEHRPKMTGFGTPGLEQHINEMFGDVIKIDGDQMAEEIYKFLESGN
jgi:hypothetical protein